MAIDPIFKIEAAWAFSRGGFLIRNSNPLLAIARRAVALTAFARTGPTALAAGGVHVVLAVLRLSFAIRFHSHFNFSIHGASPASLPGFTGRSPMQTNQPQNHYTLFSDHS
jgi:hypothetical protein